MAITKTVTVVVQGTDTELLDQLETDMTQIYNGLGTSDPRDTSVLLKRELLKQQLFALRRVRATANV